MGYILYLFHFNTVVTEHLQHHFHTYAIKTERITQVSTCNANKGDTQSYTEYHLNNVTTLTRKQIYENTKILSFNTESTHKKNKKNLVYMTRLTIFGKIT